MIYVGLAVFAVGLIFGLQTLASDDDGAARDWTASLLSVPFGRWLVALAGLCFVGTGIAAVVKGWRAKFQGRLALDDKTRPVVVCSGRIGFVARGSCSSSPASFSSWRGGMRTPTRRSG